MSYKQHSMLVDTSIFAQISLFLKFAQVSDMQSVYIDLHQDAFVFVLFAFDFYV